MVPSFGISPLKVATQHELLVQADTRAGTACASAPRITSAVRWQVCTRPLTAAGCRQLRMVPSGAVTVSGRARPAFGRMVGSTTDLTIEYGVASKAVEVMVMPA